MIFHRILRNTNIKEFLAIVSCFVFPQYSLAQDAFHAVENTNVDMRNPLASQSVIQQYYSSQQDTAQYPVNYLINTFPEKRPVDWFPQGYETVMLGGQTSILRDAQGNKVSVFPHQSLSIWGSPYGSFNAGCSLCVFASNSVASGGNGQAALSGLDPRLGAFSVANGDNAIAAFYIGQANDLTRMVLQIKSFDAQGATLEKPLTFEQMMALHHGMYMNTNVRAKGMPEIDHNGRPTNFVYSGIISSWSATRINVYGWSVLGGGAADNGKYLKSGLIPDTHMQAGSWTNLDTRSNYTAPMVYVGDPGKYFGENDYIVMDMDHVYGPHASSIDNSYERNEFDMRWKNIHKEHQASFHGYTLSFECDDCTVHHPFTEDSYGYLVNGPSELPAAYVAQVDGDALEYKGYSTWIPGNGAADPSTIGKHHIMFDFSSLLPSNNTLHFGARSYHDLQGISDWRGYDVRLGLGVDGKHVRDHFDGGSRMSDLAWNFNGQLGTICLVEPDGKTKGACLNGDGSVDVPGRVHSQEASATVLVAEAYITAPQYGTNNHYQKLSEIISQKHSEGDRIWCHNCLNHNQKHAHGTGRWIYLDSELVWRSDDGYAALD